MASKFFNSVATYSSCKEAFENNTEYADTSANPLKQTKENQDTINATIKQSQEQNQQLNTSMSTLSDQTSALQKKVKQYEDMSLSKTVLDNQTRSSDNTTDISTIKNKVDVIKKEFNTFKNKINDLTKTLKNTTDTNTDNITTLQKTQSEILNKNLNQDTRLGDWDKWRISHDNVKNPTKAGEAFQNIDNIPYDTLKSTQNTFLQNSKFEANRIIAKQQELKDAEQNEDRLILIRQSEQSKRNKYILLIVIFVFVFVIGFFLTYVQQVNKQHSVLFDGIMVVLIAASLIYAFIVYMDIQNRDPNDFSKLHPNASQLQKVDDADITSAKYSVNANSGTDLTQTGCVGEACCSNGTKWHSGECIIQS